MQLPFWMRAMGTSTTHFLNWTCSALVCGQRRWPAMIALAGLLGWTSVVAHAATDWTIKDLGTFSETSSTGLGINDLGEVTGSSYQGGYPTYHAFLYRGDVMHDISGKPQWINVGKGINNAGQVVGNSAYFWVDVPYEVTTFPFLYKNGVMTIISDKPGSAEAINNAGQIVGSIQLGGCCIYHAFLYQNGTMTSIGTLGGRDSTASAINNVGQIVGASSVANNLVQHAFLYSQGHMTDLGTLGGKYSQAWGINDKGHVVGQSWMPDMFTHAFLYSGNQMHDLGTLGGPDSIAYAINNAQQVVGISETAFGSGYSPFLFSGGKMIDLSTLPAVKKAGWILINAIAINNVGQITGFGDINGRQHAYRLSPPAHKNLGRCDDDVDRKHHDEREGKNDRNHAHDCDVKNSPFLRKK